jgi:hypothetical protein
MGVSGQHHAPGRALPPGKGPPVPIVQEASGPQSRSGHRDYRKNSLPLPGIEPRSPGRPARSQTLYWLSYPGSNRYITTLSILGKSYITTLSILNNSYIATFLIPSNRYITTLSILSNSYIATLSVLRNSYITRISLLSYSYITALSILSKSYSTTLSILSNSYNTTLSIVSNSYITTLLILELCTWKLSMFETFKN